MYYVQFFRIYAQIVFFISKSVQFDALFSKSHMIMPLERQQFLELPFPWSETVVPIDIMIRFPNKKTGFLDLKSRKPVL